MKCNICGKKTIKAFSGKILNKYDVDYFFCNNCEHLQVQEPFWLNEAYKDSIAAQDTGILKRNLDNSITTTSIIHNFFDMNGKFLDYGGGYGVFVRLMRDIGFNFVWDDKFSKNLFARGFEYSSSDKINLLTAFELLEHLDKPISELEKMFKISDNILFSQMLLPLPLKETWWYYAPKTGQHISFYTNKTLNYIANLFNKKHFYSGEYHLFTSKNITDEKFKDAVQNDALYYSRAISNLTTKIASDMKYVQDYVQSP